MKKIITWISIIIVATIVSSCEESYENHKSSCNLSMCIDAPSLNLNNRQYVAICDRDYSRNIYRKTRLSILTSEQHFEFDMGTFHELRIRLAERQQQEEWERARYDFSSDILSGKRSD